MSDSEPTLEEAILVLKALQQHIEENGPDEEVVVKYLLVKKFVEQKIQERKAMQFMALMAALADETGDTSKMSKEEMTKSVSKEASTNGGIDLLLHILNALAGGGESSKPKQTTGSKLKQLRQNYK